MVGEDIFELVQDHRWWVSYVIEICEGVVYLRKATSFQHVEVELVLGSLNLAAPTTEMKVENGYETAEESFG